MLVGRNLTSWFNFDAPASTLPAARRTYNQIREPGSSSEEET